MAKPKLFIGSSVEGLLFARALQTNVRFEAQPRVWNQGIFRTGNYILDDLLAAITENDFAAFLFLPEDISIIRGHQHPVVRDNLIFELGLFIGKIGHKRAFFLKPQGTELHLPTDLTGVNFCDFDPEDENRVAGLGAAASEILDRMQAFSTGKPSSKERSSDYDRASLIESHIAKVQPQIRGARYTRNDVINLNGDMRVLEIWEGVVPVKDDPLSSIRVRFASRSGRQANYRCESLTSSQFVTWENKGSANGVTEIEIKFDPPLKRDRPTSFRTERYVFNAYCFSREDRLEVTENKEVEEHCEMAYRHIWKSFLLQLKFPEHRFPNPDAFTLSVEDLDGNKLSSEKLHADRGLNALPETQNLIFQLEQPLPGVKYRISWELPETRGILLSDREQALVNEVNNRMLGLRVAPLLKDEVQELLRDARERFIAAIKSNLDQSIHVALYAYDRQKAGLICVATLDAPSIEDAWQMYFFKPGRGVAGNSYKSRSCVIYLRKKWDPNQDVFEDVGTGDATLHPDIIVCVPLFLSTHRRTALAILSFEAVEPTKELEELLGREGMQTKIQDLFEDWYMEVLAKSIGNSSTRVFWGHDA